MRREHRLQGGVPPHVNQSMIPQTTFDLTKQSKKHESDTAQDLFEQRELSLPSSSPFAMRARLPCALPSRRRQGHGVRPRHVLSATQFTTSSTNQIQFTEYLPIHDYEPSYAPNGPSDHPKLRLLRPPPQSINRSSPPRPARSPARSGPTPPPLLSSARFLLPSTTQHTSTPS